MIAILILRAQYKLLSRKKICFLLISMAKIKLIIDNSIEIEKKIEKADSLYFVVSVIEDIESIKF